MNLGDEWFLEVTPTYRFTFDGKRKAFFHEKGLKGIKGLERNRAVLSQVLLWTDLLCTLGDRISKPTLLSFTRVQPFLVKPTPIRAYSQIDDKTKSERTSKPRDREAEL